MHTKTWQKWLILDLKNKIYCTILTNQQYLEETPSLQTEALPIAPIPGLILCTI